MGGIAADTETGKGGIEGWRDRVTFLKGIAQVLETVGGGAGWEDVAEVGKVASPIFTFFDDALLIQSRAYGTFLFEGEG